MWKCRSLKPSTTPLSETSSMSLTSSLIVIPNFELSPPEAAHLPEPVTETRTRAPNLGRTPNSEACDSSRRSSENFSRIGMTFFPSSCPINSSRIIVQSLYPLQISNVRSSSRWGSAATSSAFDPLSRPKPKGRPASRISWTTSWS